MNNPERMYILRIRRATPHCQWQAILKDPKTEHRRTFTTALELARHLVALSEASSLPAPQAPDSHD